MIIGIPKEIKDNEFRVSLTPEGAADLVKHGNTVYTQTGAGKGSGYQDQEYIDAGAKILKTIEEIYDLSEMIVKVKEPIEREYGLIKQGQIIFSYLHLSSNKELVTELLRSGCTCIAYETIEIDNHFPLLAPMSEIAGKVASIVGAYYLGINFGAQGYLICGVTGIIPGNVLILGAGTVARSAAQIASGMGARVIIMSPFIEELREIQMNNYFGPNVSTLFLSRHNILKEINKTDILISAVYVKGAKTPILITRDMVRKMKKGSVIVAVDIDQGSSIETARPTTHKDPIYSEEGVIHYCVTNMPGIFSKTATMALTNLTLPYIIEIAKKQNDIGKNNPEVLNAINIYKGKITYEKIAQDLKMKEHYYNLQKLLGL